MRVPLLLFLALAAFALPLARSGTHADARRPNARGALSSITHPAAHSTNATAGPSPPAATQPEAAAPSTSAPGAERFLEGRVLATDGDPCTADVLAWPGGGEEEFPRTARSGADGRYRLVLPPGKWRVSAVSAADISEPLELNLSEGDHRAEDLRLKPGAIVSGCVTDPRGAPIAAAPVVCLKDDGVDILGRATTGSDGQYRLTVPPSDLLLVARVEGYAAGMERASVRAGEDARLDLRLTWGLTISGRVVGSDGQAIPGSKVTATLSDDHTTGRLLGRLEAVADRDGRYELGPLRDAVYRVRPTGDGYASEHSRTVRAGQHGVDFVLLRTGTVEGLVVRAADGSTVDVSSTDVHAGPEGPYQWLELTAGAQGTFRGDLHPGKYRVLVEKWGLASGDGVEVEVREGRTTSIRVELPRGGTMRGRVVSARGGAPVDWASVSLTRRIGGEGTGADENGRITWSGLDAGLCAFDIEARGYGELRESVEIEDGKTIDHTFVLHPEARIVGRLLGEDGRPVAHGTVQIVGRQGFNCSQETTDSGEYSIGWLSAGPCTLCWADRHPGRVALAVAVPELQEGQEQRVDLAPAHAGRIAGTVRVGSMAGRRIEVRLTSLAWEEFRGFSVETDASGRFEYVGAPPGRYTLTAGGSERDADLLGDGRDVTLEFDLPDAPVR